MISLDTLRADHLPAYGYARDTAPRLTRLAERGVVFEDCVATANWTLPTHASLMTGLSPLTHGVEEPGDTLPEGAPAYMDMTPLRFLRFIGEVRGFSGAERQRRIDEVAAKVHIENVMNQTIETLSKE